MSFSRHRGDTHAAVCVCALSVAGQAMQSRHAQEEGQRLLCITAPPTCPKDVLHNAHLLDFINSKLERLQLQRLARVHLSYVQQAVYLCVRGVAANVGLDGVVVCA